jgi:hypothetical protein
MTESMLLFTHPMNRSALQSINHQSINQSITKPTERDSVMDPLIDKVIDGWLIG